MRTDLDFQPNDDFDDAFVSDADLLGFGRPRDIVNDAVLTLGRKRQLLAYWASDIHAVRNFPALRSYPLTIQNGDRAVTFDKAPEKAVSLKRPHHRDHAQPWPCAAYGGDRL